jgi:hypothetical protein
MTRELDPEGAQHRRKGLSVEKGEYIVGGPNKVWAVDGHAKLELAGIEIYGCVDVYSRKIIWVFVGFSARTQVSVVSQFLERLEELEVMPEIIRSDRGCEIDMMVDAFYTLRQDVEDVDICLDLDIVGVCSGGIAAGAIHEIPHVNSVDQSGWPRRHVLE